MKLTHTKRTLNSVGNLNNRLLVAFRGSVGVLHVKTPMNTNSSKLITEVGAVLHVHAVQLRRDAGFTTDHRAPTLLVSDTTNNNHDTSVGKHSLVANLLSESSVAVVLPILHDLLRELNVVLLTLLNTSLLQPSKHRFKLEMDTPEDRQTSWASPLPPRHHQKTPSSSYPPTQSPSRCCRTASTSWTS